MEGLWALIGVVVGGVGTYLIESLFSRRNEGLAARLELPPLRTMIWDEDPLRLHEQVGRIRARTTLLGVEAALIAELEAAAHDCWAEGYASRDDEDLGISRGRMDRLDAALASVDSAIVRASRFRWRQRSGG